MYHKRKESKHRFIYNPKKRRDPKEELLEARIITKNLVYIIGLSPSLANKEKLIKYEYLGQYGTIIKIVVNRNKAFYQNNINGPTYSAYVTYSNPEEASIAILCLDNFIIDNNTIKASFGTTKYCSYFLKGNICNNKDCVFLHKLADENNIIKRGDLNSNKILAQQHSIAMNICDIYNIDVKNKLIENSRKNTIFPPLDSIYKLYYVVENDPNKNMSLSKKNYDNLLDTNESIFHSNNEIIKSDENNNKIKGKKESSNNSSNNEITRDCSKEEINDTILNKNKLFFGRNTSRFSFSDSNVDEKESIKIPKQIRNLLDTKINLYRLTKYMNQKVIDNILEDEYINYNDSNINDWANFIRENNDKENIKDEFENDVDYINQFIMDKVWSKEDNSK